MTLTKLNSSCGDYLKKSEASFMKDDLSNYGWLFLLKVNSGKAKML